MARDLGGTDPPLEVRHGEVRAHRGVNPGTGLLCPLPPAAADGHLIFFHAFLKNSAETRKTPVAGRALPPDDCSANDLPGLIRQAAQGPVNQRRPSLVA